MVIDGDFADWDGVKVEYRDTVGDTFHRDYPGYGGLHYKDDSGRNDLVTAKVAVDEKLLYFSAETSDPLTPHTDKQWMLLLIDADQNHKTGWYGYDYLINKKVKDDKSTSLMRYSPESAETPWVDVCDVDYRYSGKLLELALPRALVELDGEAISFDFHWCDNPSELADPISLCTAGDSAPNRRFNYRCIWKR